MSKADSFDVYGRPTCGYTVKAMKLLESKNIPFQFHNVETTSARNEIIKRSNHRTVPVIYRNNLLIGGCAELEKLF